MFSGTTEFRIPLIPSQIPLRCHPCFPAARSEIDEWCIRYSHAESQQEKAWVVDGKYGLFSFLVYPTVPQADHAVSIAKFTATAFFIDDVLDMRHFSGVKDYGSKFESVAIKGMQEGDSDPKLHTQLHMYYEVVKDLMDKMTKRQKTRFVDTISDAWNSASNYEFETTRNHDVPSIDSFIERRRVTSGVKTMFLLIESGNELDLGNAFEDPELRRLAELGMDHVWITNDIASFNKEWSDGGYLNIVPVIAHNQKCGLQQAISLACNMVRDLEQEFISLRKKMESDTAGLVKRVSGLEMYIEGVACWMSGNQEWGWWTERYQLGAILPVERECTFTLKAYRSSKKSLLIRE